MDMFIVALTILFASVVSILSLLDDMRDVRFKLNALHNSALNFGDMKTL